MSSDSSRNSAKILPRSDNVDAPRVQELTIVSIAIDGEEIQPKLARSQHDTSRHRGRNWVRFWPQSDRNPTAIRLDSDFDWIAVEILPDRDIAAIGDRDIVLDGNHDRANSNSDHSTL